MIATATPAAAILADRIRATKDLTYSDAVTLQSMLMAQLLPIRDGTVGLPVGATVRIIDQAANALDRLRRLQWAALGLDRGDPTSGEELPVLPITVLTPEAEAQIRAEREGAGQPPLLDIADECAGTGLKELIVEDYAEPELEDIVDER